MKKTILITAAALVALTLSAGCSTAEEEAPAEIAEVADNGAEEATEDEAAAEGEATAEGEGGDGSGHYKDTMVPFEELIPSDRIVIVQNVLNFTREGFFTEDTKPVTEMISYKDAETAAYQIAPIIGFLNNGLDGDLKVFTIDGTETAIGAEDFSAMYIIIDDFMSGNSPILYNPATGTEIVDFDYALTTANEAIVSVLPEEDAILSELVAMVNWGENAPCRLVATDKFYIPLTTEETAVGELRGSISGAVNASVPGMQKAGGKINDVVYVENNTQE